MSPPPSALLDGTSVSSVQKGPEAGSPERSEMKSSASVEGNLSVLLVSDAG